MAKKVEKNIITSLDIGTSKVVALIGELKKDGSIEIIGIGREPSLGLKRGVIVDIDATVNSIQRALQAAELMANCEVRTAYTGIAGSHIRSLNSHGIVAIKDKEVSPFDVDRVIEAAKAVAIPADQKILHVLPQEFIIDQQGNIREPAGMAGVRLEAKVHIVTGAMSSSQNITKCVRRCGLEVNDIILQQLAASHAVLTEDEKELGVCLLDIGGGTTDIAIFYAGSIKHSAVIPIAGDQVTNDIAMALRTPTKAAEAIKIQYGSALPALASEKEMIDVLSVNDKPVRQISARALADVICARYEELFSLILNELKRGGYEEHIPAGIILTGGGSRLKGVLELAEHCFGMPVRQGMANNIIAPADINNDPSLTTGVGLLLHGYKQQTTGYYSSAKSVGNKSLWLRVKEWFKGNF
ncbi:MAG: cell division protein FtsA [Legionellales bacterium RIFCSPHIGHO2_12_FULL_37_14]|nr:MAG: cell division protein FtsA [Legionellales bacterium RIFCSPHIGHO2_12_FULL_37_14]